MPFKEWLPFYLLFGLIVAGLGAYIGQKRKVRGKAKRSAHLQGVTFQSDDVA